MQWAKAKRMWFFYYRGGGVHYISTPMRIWQVVLVLACGARPARRADPPPRPAARRRPDRRSRFSTLIHTIVVSQARYNVPLMPLADRRRRRRLVPGRAAPAPSRRRTDPATMPEWNSDGSESGAADRKGGAGAVATIEAARLRRVLDRRQPVGRAGAAVPRGLEHDPRGHRHPQRLAARSGRRRARRTRELTADHPDRFLLGIGIGHPEATSDYTRPLKTMREFFDGLDAAETPCPRTSGSRPRSARRCSTWPRSARSARTRTSSTSEHTRFARERLGKDALVAPEVAVVVEQDPETRPRDRPRVRRALPRAEQLHEQPAQVRLHRARLRRTAAATG